MESYPYYSVVLEGSPPVTVDNPEKTFLFEIDSWCYGLSRFPEPLSAKLMYALIQEMSGAFLFAVSSHYAFDLIGLARRLFEVSEGVVNEKELAFYILAHLPNPGSLNKEGLSVFQEIVAEAQKVYPDVVQRFESRLKKPTPPK